jgi:hypothetical protein
MYILLRLRIAFNLDIAFPKVIPGFVMKFDQPVAAFQFGKNGEAFGFIQRVGMVRRCDGRTCNRVFVGLPGCNGTC